MKVITVQALVTMPTLNNKHVRKPFP